MYVGQEKVARVDEMGGLVAVEFESGRKATYPRVMYDAMLTTDPIDASELRDRRVMKVLQEYVKILIGFDLTFKEISALTLYVENFINEKKEYAQAKVLRPHIINPAPESAHHAAQLEALSIGDVDRILSIGDVDRILKDGRKDDTA